MHEKGFHLSLEALFSICLLLSLLALSFPPAQQNLIQLAIMQKQHDLLKLWHVNKTFDLEEMSADFQLAFPGLAGKIVLQPEGEAPQEKIVGQWLEESGRENYAVKGRIYRQGKFYLVEVFVSR